MVRLAILVTNRTDYEAAVKNKLPIFANFIFVGNATTAAQREDCPSKLKNGT